MKIKELLSSPDKWTKGAYARDKNGMVVGVRQPEAICFCLAGYVHKCYSVNGVSRLQEIHMKIYYKLRSSISTWNDAPERTFEEVKQLVEELDI